MNNRVRKMLWACVFLFCYFCLSSATLDPSRVRLIDYSPESNNFLFRSNEPLSKNTTFAYTELMVLMRAVAQKNNLTIPSDAFLVDVNLLNGITEEKYIKKEKDFFAKNKDKGKFLSRPIFGSLVNPQKIASAIRKEMALTLEDWSVDKLPRLMGELRSMILTKSKRSTVVFVHCMAGEDRTGEVSGSYYITYLDKSFNEALSYDNHVENRDIRCMSEHEFAWYCWYLKYKVNPSYLGDCIPQNATYCSW